MGLLIEKHAEKIPHHTSLCFDDKIWIWRIFNQESIKIANYFLSIGNKKGDIVAVMMENSLEFFSVIMGLNKIQGISSLTNINQRRQALTHAFKISEPKYIIIDGDCLSPFIDIYENLNIDKN